MTQRRLPAFALTTLATLLVGVTPGSAQQKLMATPVTPHVTAGANLGYCVDVANAARVVIDPKPAGMNTFLQEAWRTNWTGDCTTRWSGSVTVSYWAFGQTEMMITAYDAAGRVIAQGPLRFVVDRFKDENGDGLPDWWASALIRSDAVGRDDDPDGDGITNINEFRARTHPHDRYWRYFAECSDGERQKLSCFIVGGWADMFGDDGRRNMGGDKQRQIAARGVLTRAVSDRPTAFEKIVQLGDARRVVSTAHGVAEPRTTWYFADGAGRGDMDLFFLTYNPNTIPVDATFTYFTDEGTEPVAITHTLPPGVRTTIWVNADERALKTTDVATQVSSTEPIFVERAWRANPPGRTVPHENARPGVAELSTRWYFAEGDKEVPHDTALVLFNPSLTKATVRVTSLFGVRTPSVSTWDVAPQSRVRIPLLALDNQRTQMSMLVESLNQVGIVAERSTSGLEAEGWWREASFGATEPRSFAYFTLSHPLGRLTLMNPTSQDAHVTVYSCYSMGTYSCRYAVKEYIVPPMHFVGVISRPSYWDDHEGILFDREVQVFSKDAAGRPLGIVAELMSPSIAKEAPRRLEARVTVAQPHPIAPPFSTLTP